MDEADNLWLIDFGSATLLLEEQPGPRALLAQEGSLPYLSPEQTGRMNRGIDQRSDLYALGVTLYQMLTGRLPFTGGDALAWVHSHLALAPVPPRQLEPELPPVVEELVLKLLAKSADERYQSAASLEADLARCLAQLEERGEVAPFALGQSERGGRFRLPQRLYGRESERAALEEAFTRMVASGEAALALVGGYSGTGKSSLVQELYRPITACGGLFASGKFDQLSRDVPYATLVQALRGLVRDLLTLEEAELRGWKERLRTALGTHVRLMVDLIPELALLTGPGEPIPAVGPAEARNRFHFAFRGFIQAFATPAHPLTLFLDDMQWADPSTYDFVTAMLCEGGMHHLLVILAWRDTEVDAAHPFSVHLARLRREGPLRCELRLGPLEREHVASLLEDALGCAPRECASLAERVHRQTGGIPFFVLQFLRALHRDGLLVYDGSAWRWDDEAIARRGYTDNVIDLLRERLFELEAPSREALSLAACIGSSFTLHTLALASAEPEGRLAEALWWPVREGLVVPPASYERGELPPGDVPFRFQHDRIQQAAYELIAPEQRVETHLRIG
ncbi:MAG TPA: AAA family ATPase, partial [Myxococcaceae bacterium]|nr:AAA family ATPase [Myxococcaceae bacterium]